jgi:RNA polymerase sigma-70 factor (ECF subfamily)
LSGPADEAVVRLCQKGDREAFAVLVERHRTMLFGTAYLMTRDRQLAEDAVQEALIATWTSIGSLRNPSGLKAWLARIVVNEVRQQARKRRIPLVTLEELPDPPEADGAIAGIAGNEMRQDLARALETLPTDQREAVVLRFFSDLTVPEIAAATGSREGTVKSRLSRAMDKLGEMLRSYGNGEGRK